MTARIFLKIIAGVACILVVALAAADWLATRVTERTYLAALTRQVGDKAQMLALIMGKGKVPGTEIHTLAHAAAARITYIDHAGRVVADSETDASKMENHSQRPEVKAALGGRTGSDRRRSATIGMNFLYVAVPLADGAVLRLAVPLKEIEAQIRDVTRQVLLAVLLAFVPAVAIAAFFARVISRKVAKIIDHASKLARGDFESRLAVTQGDELDVLSEQLNRTGEHLRHMVDELDREHEKLDRLERVRKDFVINVSHELRTPLASIQGYTETLLDGALEDPQHNVRFLNIIRNNAERLARLVGDLMTLSRLELKQTSLVYSMHKVNDLIRECVESVLPVAEKANIDLVADAASTSPEVYCDSEAVHQILLNLLDNAIKYTSESGTVSIGAVTSHEGFVRIDVGDTGIGVPPEDLPRLFERFYRVDKARSRQLGGTGLGLAIVKHLVMAHGGEVSVRSVVNQGSTFSFTLPTKAPARDRLEEVSLQRELIHP